MKIAFDIAKFLTTKALKFLLIVVLILASIHLKNEITKWYKQRDLHQFEMETLRVKIASYEEEKLSLLKSMKLGKKKMQEQFTLQKKLHLAIKRHNDDPPLFFLLDERAQWEAELKLLEASLASSEALQKQLFKLSREARKTQATLKSTTLNQSLKLQQMTEKWHQYNWFEKHVKTITGTILSIALLLLLAPFLNRLFWYFLPGAWVENQAPFQLNPKGESNEITFWSDSNKQIKIHLEPDETISVKQDCYNSFDEHLARKNRFLWDRSAWIISYSAEMINMTDFHNPDTSPRQITLIAPQAEDELCKITLKDCQGLILKPSQIIATKGNIKLRTKWNFFSIHNWLRLVFRHIIFSGTGEIFLYLHGGGNEISADSLRIKEDKLVAYQSSCPVGLVRNENLWHYLLGKCNLFDYRFNSDKFILMQNQSSPLHTHKTPGERFFDTILNTIGKFLGF
ncbi:AIM24 family protein [Lentisphaera profundi]|uniref:AIM24 family protein n=1 Tax=Lentisphaera profundi TaxID=1658616 RepID=A0ABY7VZB3_9BACT|nr:AIM24 family protein [Lentisphaera profundi]WDE98126.1 AIM24 family protein [Lentisphaera profundi]